VGGRRRYASGKGRHKDWRAAAGRVTGWEVLAGRGRDVVLCNHLVETGGQQIDSVVQRVFVERSWGFFGDEWSISLVFGQDATGEFEVVEGLLAGHAGALRQDKPRLGLWCNVSGELPLGVQLGTALGSRYALHAARVGQFSSIRYEPSFTVRRRVNACCRCANKQH
jgi:hypothetical protein